MQCHYFQWIYLPWKPTCTNFQVTNRNYLIFACNQTSANSRRSGKLEQILLTEIRLEWEQLFYNKGTYCSSSAEERCKTSFKKSRGNDKNNRLLALEKLSSNTLEIGEVFEKYNAFERLNRHNVQSYYYNG